MDLNALPEDEEEEQFVGSHGQDAVYYEDHTESAVETFRREREERRRRLKREYQDDLSTNRASQIPRCNSTFVVRNHRPNDRMGHVPSGWLDCPPCGKPIHNIIPSKVPLSESFNEYIMPGKRYHFRRVIKEQNIAGRQLGLVIDLTNTNRYYSAEELKRQGIKHCKIRCKGRDEVPDNQSTNIFCHEVSQFSQRRDSKYILVHCTHGHNRTGFMIIHYLVRYHGFSVTEAINEFANARPPGIYKGDYIDALYAFYHEKKPEFLVCPSTPEWKSELDLNGDSVPNEDDDGNTGDSSLDQEGGTENDVMTNDDVLGDAISYDQQLELQRVCCIALGTANGNLHGNMHFPGSQPVSLDRANLQLLRQRYYYATWKADGTRYMMLITYHGCYLIDRKFSFRRVQMRFPSRSPTLDERNHQHFTLLDGEMVIDTEPGTGKQSRRYLVYDLMMLNHKPVIQLPFCERWNMIEKEVIEPRNIERCTPSHYDYNMESIRVRRKSFWMLSAVRKVLVALIPTLSHEADGLIFQGWDDPYIPRTHEGLLKWKYAHMNSVDFLFEDGDEAHALYLFDKGKKRRLEGAHVAFKDCEDGTQYSGKIIECSWDPQQMCWEFMRVRVDKTTPNAWHVYKKVMQSIEDNITQDVLLDEIDEIIKLPMYADRIAKESHGHHHTGKRRC